ncbi:hypothetical protein M0R72_22080 [Candidatus Pacearchaeota archaeon]|jgi:hypothetical protein|nr:hypothetical protein [Candidatus Pacearchaeota archaeon]
MTKYFEPDLEADRQRGYADAVAGRKSTTRTAASVSAYSTGYEEGYDERQEAIRKTRIETLNKARSKRAGRGR